MAVCRRVAGAALVYELQKVRAAQRRAGFDADTCPRDRLDSYDHAIGRRFERLSTSRRVMLC